MRTLPFGPANPAFQPAPAPHAMIRRRAPAPPAPLGRGRGPERPGSYPRPSIPSDQSAFVRPFGTSRNLFADFIPNNESPAPPPPTMVRTFPGLSRTPSPPPPPASRTPSPDIFLELYEHSRHPVDTRSHLTILPSWSRVAEKEEKGECVICYGDNEHLQIQCQNCGTLKVCCMCVVGVYQSINSCPVCRFRGEF